MPPTHHDGRYHHSTRLNECIRTAPALLKSKTIEMKEQYESANIENVDLRDTNTGLKDCACDCSQAFLYPLLGRSSVITSAGYTRFTNPFFLPATFSFATPGRQTAREWSGTG